MSKFLLAIIATFSVCGFPATSQPFWEPTTGPYGGSVRSLTKSTGGVLFCGTLQGVYSSTNSGASWERRGTMNASILKLCPGRAGQILALSQIPIAYRYDPTLDDWISLENPYFRPASICVKDDGTLIAGALTTSSNAPCLYRSTDNGATWAGIDATKNLGKETVADIETHGDSLIIFIQSQRVYVSRDDGRTWASSHHSGLQFRAIHKIDSSNFLFTTPTGVFRTNDSLAVLYETDLSNVAASDLDSEGNTVVLTSYNGFYYSLDKGRSWAFRPQSLRDFQSVAISHSIIFAGFNDSGLVRSTDIGATWQASNSGIANTSVSVLACAPDRTLYSVHGPSLVAMSQDMGASWQLITVPIEVRYPKLRQVHVSTTGNIFAVGPSNIFKSVNNASSWSELLIPYKNVQWISTTAAGRVAYVTGSKGAVLSTDDGSTWIYRSTIPDREATIRIVLDSLLFVTLSNESSYRSTDWGITWQYAGINIDPNCLAAVSSGAIMAAHNQLVSLSTDRGATWVNVTAGLPPNATIQALESDGTKTFVVATEKGVCVFDLGRFLWTKLQNTGLPVANIRQVTIHPNGRLFIAMTGNGVWRSSGPVLSVADQATNHVDPRDVAIYPNPVTPVSRIKFELEHSGTVTIRIVDVLGRVVIQRVLVEMSAGSHTLPIEAPPSGQYFLQLITSKGTRTFNFVSR
ncbi:MAG: T9SS type A sorting domain-containing protein [Ignavibacteriae bacterium]|nr:T9SS type A sorting domain-containing protein [Ignavibacteriota bacterium]